MPCQAHTISEFIASPIFSTSLSLRYIREAFWSATPEEALPGGVGLAFDRSAEGKNAGDRRASYRNLNPNTLRISWKRPYPVRYHLSISQFLPNLWSVGDTCKSKHLNSLQIHSETVEKPLNRRIYGLLLFVSARYLTRQNRTKYNDWPFSTASADSTGFGQMISFPNHGNFRAEILGGSRQE
jgi:hypothetical protein